MESRTRFVADIAKPYYTKEEERRDLGFLEEEKKYTNQSKAEKQWKNSILAIIAKLAEVIKKNYVLNPLHKFTSGNDIERYVVQHKKFERQLNAFLTFHNLHFIDKATVAKFLHSTDDFNQYTKRFTEAQTELKQLQQLRAQHERDYNEVQKSLPAVLQLKKQLESIKEELRKVELLTKRSIQERVFEDDEDEVCYFIMDRSQVEAFKKANFDSAYEARKRYEGHTFTIEFGRGFDKMPVERAKAMIFFSVNLSCESNLGDINRILGNSDTVVYNNAARKYNQETKNYLETVNHFLGGKNNLSIDTSTVYNAHVALYQKEGEEIKKHENEMFPLEEAFKKIKIAREKVLSQNKAKEQDYAPQRLHQPASSNLSVIVHESQEAALLTQQHQQGSPPKVH